MTPPPGLLGKAYAPTFAIIILVIVCALIAWAAR
jgi:hypothetical protein